MPYKTRVTNKVIGGHAMVIRDTRKKKGNCLLNDAAVMAKEFG